MFVRLLVTYFNSEELYDLAFSLGLELDSIAGRSSTLGSTAIRLVDYLNRRARLNDLVAQIRVMRPEVQFPLGEPIARPKPLPVESLRVVAEAKLILVGDGNVGKTSLVNRLVKDRFNQDENTTRGVAISKWYIRLSHDEVPMARLNIWDFGGQGSMHATHPYFFSRRAVYLVVLNVREDDRANRVEYWLRLVSSFASESPIIIVANKADQYSAKLDERTLKIKFPMISDFVRTSCMTGNGLAELRQAITTSVSTIEDIAVRTPVSLIKLRQRLEAMTDPKGTNTRDTFSLSEYEALCDEYEINPSQRPGFLRRLNDMGVMLYFDDPRLDLNVVLNPVWVTDGIYRIINDESLALSSGRLNTQQVRANLPKDRYPADKAMYILDMMRKFELCFALDDQEKEFLLPDLLSPLQPELPLEVDRSDALRFQFEYPVWQGAILTRLLVRLNHYLYQDFYWRNGAVFRSSDGKNYALVIADETDRRLRIWVSGNPATRRNFLNRIREELDVIHSSQREQIKEWVITPQGGEISYKLLAGLEAKGTKTHDVLIDDNLVELDVTELLSGVRAEVIPDGVRLKELIKYHLSLDEIDDLLFRFRISLDDIEGDNRDAKARNLVRFFERRQHIPELMAVLRDLRKEVVWA